jgi:hypothetical protein
VVAGNEHSGISDEVRAACNYRYVVEYIACLGVVGEKKEGFH